jgi:hypothetical protein
MTDGGLGLLQVKMASKTELDRNKPRAVQSAARRETQANTCAIKLNILQHKATLSFSIVPRYSNAKESVCKVYKNIYFKAMSLC